MTVIIKEKAVFCFTGKQWLNLAQAKAITPDDDNNRVTIGWADGSYQRYHNDEAEKILQALQEYMDR